MYLVVGLIPAPVLLCAGGNQLIPLSHIVVSLSVPPSLPSTPTKNQWGKNTLGQGLTKTIKIKLNLKKRKKNISLTPEEVFARGYYKECKQ